jgi:hypothetical protein
VAQGIVDVLEPIKIQEHHRDVTAMAVASCRGQGLLKPALKVGAVGQVGQGVEMRQMVDLLFCRLALRDVDEAADVVLNVAVCAADGGDRKPLRVDAAVLASVPDFALPLAGAPDRLPHGAIRLRR